jgi:cell division septation protein DedD
VQVLATPERALADRVAAEAAERLGSIARVEKEGSLYKVRLGAFATEAEAQGLRDRAVEMGYPGAFRVKNGAPATDG